LYADEGDLSNWATGRGKLLGILFTARRESISLLRLACISCDGAVAMPDLFHAKPQRRRTAR
jgi:hypothetical protein